MLKTEIYLVSIGLMILRVKIVILLCGSCRMFCWLFKIGWCLPVCLGSFGTQKYIIGPFYMLIMQRYTNVKYSTSTTQHIFVSIRMHVLLCIYWYKCIANVACVSNWKQLHITLTISKWFDISVAYSEWYLKLSLIYSAGSFFKPNVYVLT